MMRIDHRLARRLTLVLGLAGCGLSALGAIAPLFAVVGALVAAGALLAQWRESGPVIIPFTIDDWIPDGGGSLVLGVPAARHGRRSPIASVFVRTTDELRLEEVVVGVAARADGTLELSVGDNDQVRACLCRGEVRIT